ncbi:MAG: hypothetical protein OEW42_19510 [Acidimicrobiia bacterium]|nr:hypothetical protein [Acidimicrobiia bacterium]
MAALVGHRFPGGTYRIEHWENFLFSEATGIDTPADGIAHPAHLFHVAINGVGTSITEIFDLVGSGDGSPVSIDYYDWQIHQPLREDVTYVLRGGITAFERSARDGSPIRDSFTYEIQIDDPSALRVADVAFRWHHWRPAEEATR